MQRSNRPSSQRPREVLQAFDRRLPPRLSALARRIADRHVLLQASSLAFYGLVSALPLLLIGFSVVEAVVGREPLQSFVTEVGETGPEGTGQFLRQLAQNAGLTWVTLVFTLWPATAYGGGLRRALQTGSERGDPAPGLRGRVMGLGLILVLPVLLLGGIPMMFVVLNLTRDGWVGALLGGGAALVAGTVIGTLVTTALFQVFSPARLRWRDALIGAATTASITAMFSLGFVLYLNLGRVQDRFGGGTIAVVVLLGVWLFVANTLLLSGYEAALELGDEAAERGAA